MKIGQARHPQLAKALPTSQTIFKCHPLWIDGTVVYTRSWRIVGNYYHYNPGEPPHGAIGV